MDKIIYIEGLPKAQPRVKSFIRGNHAGVYDPGTADGWKQTVAVAATNAGLKNLKLDVPVKLEIEFYLPRPKSHYHTGKRKNELRKNAHFFVTSKPDADNLTKAVMDALTEIHLWKDDSYVVYQSSKKQYTTENNPNPGCFLSIQSYFSA